MIDPALAAIIGALITTIGTIIVTLIKSKQDNKQENGILIPSDYKFHKPKQQIRWFTFLGVVLLGGIIGYGVSFLSIHQGAKTSQTDDFGFIRIDSDDYWWAYLPRLLPKGVSPDLNDPDNEASSLVESSYQAAFDEATSDKSYKTWPKAPTIRYEDDDTTTKLGVSITASGSNSEWVRISNIMQVSISYEPISDHVQLVEITGAGGAGEERVASTPVKLSSDYDIFIVDVRFPESDFFTLQPGEVEVFNIPLECKSPGLYRIKLKISYSYEGNSQSKSFANFPTQVCPNRVTYWYWEWRFHHREEYFWNGSGYDQSR